MSTFHHRNKHNGRYNMQKLIEVYPALEPYVTPLEAHDLSIDFSDSKAVKVLNQALLYLHYGIENWDFPDGHLCPPIPGRVDYIHHLADLVGEGEKRILDIGCGATCIYPTLGVAAYGWKFTGSDIEQQSIENARRIVQANPVLKDQVRLTVQKDRREFFEGVIGAKDFYDATMCNPPFYRSMKEADEVHKRKLRNLKGKKMEVDRNFAGTSAELVYEGGEFNFINSMIYKSRAFAQKVGWFTSLVSKGEHLKGLFKQLDKMEVQEYKVVEMGTGNKKTRILAWRYEKA